MTNLMSDSLLETIEAIGLVPMLSETLDRIETGKSDYINLLHLIGCTIHHAKHKNKMTKKEFLKIIMDLKWDEPTKERRE